VVQIEIKTLGFDKFLRAVANAPEAIRRATARTLNETLTKSQSLMAKHAAASYRITQRDIRASFRTHLANFNDLNASVKSVGTKFPLFKFGVVARKEEQVVISEVRSSRTPLAHGFMAIVGAVTRGSFSVGERRDIRLRRWSDLLPLK
jgi:hypothetical protein